jgi:anti-anti-sigma regulatory factor
VKELIERGRIKVFNLAEVAYVDSAGLGPFVRSYTLLRLRRQRGVLKLLRPARDFGAYSIRPN